MNDKDRARHTAMDDVVPQQATWLGHIRHGCLGFAVLALAGSVVVGLYALIAASRPDCVGSCPDRTVATGWGWSVVAASAALLIAAAVVRMLRGPLTRRGDRTDIVGALALAYLLVVGIAATEVQPWTDLHWLLTLRPTTTQGPAVAAAGLLSMLGAVALGLGRRAVSHDWKPVPRSAIGGAALALIVVAASIVVAANAGDDSRFVQASTAGDGGVPPAPSVFGEQRFHIRFSDRPADPNQARFDYPDILSAGSAFVVFDRSRGELIAYEFDGQQRWHYRRTGPDVLRVIDAHVYDDGRTLVVALANSNGGPDAKHTFIGLDAVSGQQLWMRSGELLEDAFWPGHYPSPYFVARQRQSWTAFNPRTGKQIWQISNPDRCGSPGQLDGASGLLVDVDICQGEGAITYTLVTVDAATGNVVRRQQLQHIENGSGPLEGQRVEKAGGDGVVVTITWPDGRRLNTYANAVTGHTTDLGATYVSTDEARGRGFFTQSESGFVNLIGADGMQRCTFPFAVSPVGDGSHVGIAWYPHQLAYTNDIVGDRTYLRVADRETCQIQQSLPITGEPLTLRTARGVTVLLSTDDTGVYLTGYSS